MPVLPMMNFQNIAPQGIPALRDLFSNLQQGIQTAYLPQSLRNQNQLGQLENALKGVQLKYAPQTAEADLANKLAGTDLLKQQSQYYGPNILSEIDLRNLMRQMHEQEMQFKPFELASNLDPITKMIAGRQLAGQLANSIGTPSHPNISSNDNGFTLNPMGQNIPRDSGTMSMMQQGGMSPMQGQRLPGGLTQQQGAQFLNGINNAPSNAPNVMNQGGNLSDLYDQMYNTQLQNALQIKNPAFGSAKGGAGGTYTNPLTGETYTTNTSGNTQQDQASIAALERVKPLMQEIAKNLAPFQTLSGKADLKGQEWMNKIFGQNNPLPGQYAKAQSDLELVAESLIKSFGLRTTDKTMKSMRNAISPKEGESANQYQSRISDILNHLENNVGEAKKRLSSGQSLTDMAKESSQSSERNFNPATGKLE